MGIPADIDILLGTKQAMDYLGVSRSTLYRLMRSGQLTGFKVGRTWRFPRTRLQGCMVETPLN